MLNDGLVSLVKATNALTSLLGQPNDRSVMQIVAWPKDPPRPYLIVNSEGPPAGETLDGVSALTDGIVQFDSYGDTPQTAQRLSATLRVFLIETFNAGALPDGTTVQFVAVEADRDMPYEEGGTGILYRRMLRLHAFWTESLS